MLSIVASISASLAGVTGIESRPCYARVHVSEVVDAGAGAGADAERRRRRMAAWHASTAEVG